MTATPLEANWFLLFSTHPSRSALYDAFYEIEAGTGALAPGVFIATASEAFDEMTRRSVGRWCGLLLDYETLNDNRSAVDQFADRNPHAVLLVDTESSSQVVPAGYERVMLPAALDDWSGFLRRHVS